MNKTEESRADRVTLSNMTTRTLENIPLPADAIDAFDWSTCPCGDCDTPTRVFITYQRLIKADQGAILVQATGVQSLTATGKVEVYRNDFATVAVSDDICDDCYCEEHSPAMPARLAKAQLWELRSALSDAARKVPGR
jgi:hypothetical protein